jgi:hypothetical protein
MSPSPTEGSNLFYKHLTASGQSSQINGFYQTFTSDLYTRYVPYKSLLFVNLAVPDAEHDSL